MHKRLQNRVVDKHLGFINEVGRRLREDGYGVGSTQTASLTDQFPGLQALLNSLVSASVTPRKVDERLVEDWNPFSQRVLLSDEQPPSARGLERNFAVVAAYVQTFVEWGHEAIHILALEPFFSGHRRITTKRQFLSWNLAGEALGFWYADMVMTPAIRACVPGAELVYNRRSVSNSAFHPEQAFAQLGISDRTEMLRIYADAFLGKKTLLGATAGPYTKALGRQVHDFYLGTTGTLSKWYRLLCEFDFFDGYYERFCTAKNIPSLLSEEALAEAAEQSSADYIVSLGTEWLPAMRELDPRRIARVCVRRHIQTRAYFAWFLQRALAKDWVFGAGQPLDGKALATNLDAYLNGLEAAMSTLAGGAAPATAIATLKELDAAYERTVQRRLARNRAHVKYRYRLYPFFEPTDGIVGLCDERSALSTKEMVEIVRFVMKRWDWDGEGAGSADDGVTDTLSGFFKATRTGNANTIRKKYNEFMVHPRTLPVWSVGLSQFKPAQNQFQEMVFEYT